MNRKDDGMRRGGRLLKVIIGVVLAFVIFIFSGVFAYATYLGLFAFLATRSEPDSTGFLIFILFGWLFLLGILVLLIRLFIKIVRSRD